MKLITLCQAAGIACPLEHENLEIQAICTDSRRIVKGGLYVAICGLRSNGHDYIKDAIGAGAICILTEEGVEYSKALESGVAFISAKNTRRAAACLFDAWYGFPTKKLKIIGVTGTNGKTSVTHMLRHVLQTMLCKCGLIGTVGCESGGRFLDSRGSDALANMTTPDPEELYRILSEMVADGVEYVLMEVTSHALALGKLEPIRFAAAIFTNLTPEHLDFHGDMEHYADAKAELFGKSELSVIHANSPYAERMIKAATGRVITTGIGVAADYCATGEELLGEDGVRYRLSSNSFSLQIRCPIPGRFTVANSMQAAACALELGFGAGAVKDALSSLSGVKGRMEKVKLGLGADFSLFIDYAHTPDALENLLRTARGFCQAGQRLVLVFGCGGDRDRSKRALMGRIASTHADRVIITSDNSRGEDPDTIIKEILDGVENRKYTVIPERREAIRQAVLEAERGDVILLAGKGHEEYEIDRNGRHPFCEKKIALEAFEERSRKQKNTGDRETGL